MATAALRRLLLDVVGRFARPVVGLLTPRPGACVACGAQGVMGPGLGPLFVYPATVGGRPARCVVYWLWQDMAGDVVLCARCATESAVKHLDAAWAAAEKAQCRRNDSSPPSPTTS